MGVIFGINLHLEKEKTLQKTVFFYVFIQVAIWAKVLVYFILLGSGQTVAIHTPHVFLNPLLFFESFLSFNGVERFDLLFHQTMHVLIALCVFLLSKHYFGKKISELFKIFFVAAVLHNVGYWLTNVFASPELLLIDFFGDIFALFFFYYLFRLVNSFNFIKRLKIPFFE